VFGLGNNSGYASIAGVILTLGGIIVGVGKGAVVGAAKIDKEFVWVKGAHPTFLADFPEWTGPN
jgi:hypothetical protein